MPPLFICTVATKTKDEEPEEIRITYGYSHEHRPDLKQFVVDLMSTGDGGVPLFLRVANGNEADQPVFAELLRDFRARLDLDALFVADSALYSAENLATLGNLRWLCRVPRTLGEAGRVLAETPREAFVESGLHEGYRIAQTQSYYAGVAHRWLLVHSEELRKAASERLEHHLCLREKELGRQLSRLSHKTFACRADAFQAAEAFASEHLENHHRLDDPQIVRVARDGKRGRPAKGAEPEEIRYGIKAKRKRDEAAIAEELERSGRYILATNIPSEPEELTNDELLTEYKGRQSVERGFRFLKDPFVFHLQRVRKDTSTCGSYRDGHGIMPFGLCDRVVFVARSSSQDWSDHSPPERQTDPTTDAAVGIPAVPGGASLERGRREANLQPHRRAKRSILGVVSSSCWRYYLLS